MPTPQEMIIALQKSGRGGFGGRLLGGPPNLGYPYGLRSEPLEYELGRENLATTPMTSILGALLNPQQSALFDAIRGGAMDQMRAAAGPNSISDMYGSVNLYGK